MSDTISSQGAKGRFVPKNRKLISGIIVLAVILAFAWAEKARRDAVRQLEQTNTQLEELKKSTQNSSQETAKRVRENVSKLMNIPLDPPPTVATISDVEKLKESNEFFKVAENGDYLILTGNRAILYDLDRNIILDVAPFRVNTPAGGTASPSPTAKSKVTPSPSPKSIPAAQ